MFRQSLATKPYVTWIEKYKLANIPAGVAFPEVVPDFVIERRSTSDSLKTLREKMEEYRSNGVFFDVVGDQRFQ